jgi:hypothetical protein
VSFQIEAPDKNSPSLNPLELAVGRFLGRLSLNYLQQGSRYRDAAK